MKKRKRGRPQVAPDYLFSVFALVEQKRERTGLSVSRVCERMVAKGPLVLVRPKTGETVEIKSGKTLRSRYQEVLAALAWPPDLPRPGDSLDEVCIVRGDRIFGIWGPTKKEIQVRRRRRKCTTNNSYDRLSHAASLKLPVTAARETTMPERHRKQAHRG